MNRRQTTKLLGATALATLAGPLAAAGTAMRQPALPPVVDRHLQQFSAQLQLGLQEYAQAQQLIRTLITPVKIEKAEVQSRNYTYIYRNAQDQRITLSRQNGQLLTILG